MVPVTWEINGKSVPMEIVKARYAANNNICLTLYYHDSDNSYSPYCMLTTNTMHKLPKNHVAIKDYGENVGVLEKLIANEIVEIPTEYIPSGYVVLPICKLKHKALMDR